jgi:hypothetical protein
LNSVLYLEEEEEEEEEEIKVLYVKDIFIDFCQLLNLVKIHGVVVTKSVVYD